MTELITIYYPSYITIAKTNVYQRQLKDILPQKEHILKYFLVLCSPVDLLKHNIYALFERLKQYFTCFDCSIFLCALLLPCGRDHPVIQAETDVTFSA